MELTIDQKRALAMAEAQKLLRDRQNTPAVSGNILPLSRMQDGSVSFDINAGIPGALISGATLPGDVYSGKTQVFDESGSVSDEVLGRTNELAAIGTPINPAVRAGSNIIPGEKQNFAREKVDVPTANELKASGSKAFDAMRNTNAIYPSAGVKQVADALKVKLNEQGLDDVTAPNTFKTLEKLSNPPEGSFATAGNLHSARKTFGKIGQNFNNPPDQKASAMARDGIDDLIRENPIAGNLLDRGNSDFAAGSRSELIGGIDEIANLRAAAANSGQNIGNTLRQRVASALGAPKRVAGFNDAERSALARVVEGSRGANLTRDASNLLGGGGGLGALAAGAAGTGAGFGLGGPTGALIGLSAPAIGRLLKAQSNKMTQKDLAKADEMVRKRSALYEERLQNALKEVGPTRNKAAIAKLVGMLANARVEQAHVAAGAQPTAIQF